LTGSYYLAKISNLVPTTTIGINNGCTLALSSFYYHFSSIRYLRISIILDAGLALVISSKTFYKCSLIELNQNNKESIELPGVDKSITIQTAVFNIEC
jgi:hypothetical protein